MAKPTDDGDAPDRQSTQAGDEWCTSHAEFSMWLNHVGKRPFLP
jgi:hypothetical protein